VAEVFAPTPAELLRKYGAKRLGDRYEVSALNLPWVFKREVEVEISPGKQYRISGVEVVGVPPPWETYVALVDRGGEFGVGYVASPRRGMFQCIRKPYAYPLGVKTPPHIVVKLVELLLTDASGVVECVDRAFTAGYLAVFINAPISVVQKAQVRIEPVVEEMFK